MAASYFETLAQLPSEPSGLPGEKPIAPSQPEPQAVPPAPTAEEAVAQAGTEPEPAQEESFLFDVADKERIEALPQELRGLVEEAIKGIEKRWKDTYSQRRQHETTELERERQEIQGLMPWKDFISVMNADPELSRVVLNAIQGQQAPQQPQQARSPQPQVAMPEAVQKLLGRGFTEDDLSNLKAFFMGELRPTLEPISQNIEEQRWQREAARAEAAMAEKYAKGKQGVFLPYEDAKAAMRDLYQKDPAVRALVEKQESPLDQAEILYALAIRQSIPALTRTQAATLAQQNASKVGAQIVTGAGGSGPPKETGTTDPVLDMYRRHSPAWNAPK